MGWFIFFVVCIIIAAIVWVPGAPATCPTCEVEVYDLCRICGWRP